MLTIRIGRSSDNDYVTPTNDATVSRHHAVLTVHTDGRATIRDLNSTTGTLVNNKRVDGEAPIDSSSTIRIGNSTYTLSQFTKSKPKVTHKPPVNPPNLSSSKGIGRDLSNAIRVSAPDVSSRHAVIGKDGNGNTVIVDLGSTNGTYVNGTRITGPTVLRSGDTVRLGSSATVPWQDYFKPESKRPKNKLWLICGGVAAAVAVIFGVYWYISEQNKNKEWSSDRIFNHYKTSVAFIYNESGYAVTLGGYSPSEIDSRLSEYDIVHVDGRGEVKAGAQGASGTGFFISDDGRLLTNRHVLFPMQEEEHAIRAIKNEFSDLMVYLAQNADTRKEAAIYRELGRNIDVRYVNTFTGIALNDTHVANKNELIPATPLRKSDNLAVDVAMLQINNKKTPEGITIVNVNDIPSKDELKPGHKIFTIGFPKGLTIGATPVGIQANNQSGEVTQERGENQFGHNMLIDHGASGSPVFDSHGKFAGIVSSCFERDIKQGYNQAVNADKVKQFVNN